jgi:ribose 5-phosphate isomerase B
MNITSMPIAIGTDHRGFAHKEYIKQHYTVFDGVSITWIDVGAYNTDRSDYPIYASKVAELISAGQAERGVLLCGSGIGMVIAANRYHGIYAGLAWNETVARFAAEHDKVNVLSIPADYVSPDLAIAMIDAWLKAPFFGDRYQQRIDLIDRIK